MHLVNFVGVEIVWIIGQDAAPRKYKKRVESSNISQSYLAAESHSQEMPVEKAIREKSVNIQTRLEKFDNYRM